MGAIKIECRWLCSLHSVVVLRLTVNLSSRKIPGLNVYAQMQNEKEQEMRSPANPTEATAGSQRDLVHSVEILDTEFNSRPIGEDALSSESWSVAHIAICYHSHRMFHDTHPVPLFFFVLFLRGEMFRWRDEQEINHSSVIRRCPFAVLLLLNNLRTQIGASQCRI